MPMKDRDYKRENELAKRRGERSCGSDGADAVRHRARYDYEKKNGDLPANVHIDHKKPIKNGGGNTKGNTRTRAAKNNCAAGGKIGNRKQKGIKKP